MTSLQEAAKELNEAFKTERERKLETKIQELEEVIINLSQRLDYLESKCH